MSRLFGNTSFKPFNEGTSYVDSKVAVESEGQLVALPPVIEEKLCDIADALAAREVADRDVLIGCDDTGQEIHRVTVTYNNGDVEVTDFINGVPQVTQSPSFTTDKPAPDQLDVERDVWYATNTTVGDAEYGRIIQLEKRNVFVNGVIDPAQTTFVDVNQTPEFDATALVTVAPYTLNAQQIRVELTGEQIAVTGAAAAVLAAIPATATYAEIYIDAPDSNIRWTKDGSAPADNNGEQELAGSTIRLLDRDEIDGFRALTIGGDGALDPALTANLTVNYWNIEPTED